MKEVTKKIGVCASCDSFDECQGACQRKSSGDDENCELLSQISPSQDDTVPQSKTATEVIEDNSSNRSTQMKADQKIVDAYDYLDERAKVAYQVVRFEPKGFAIRRKDTEGNWLWNIDGITRIPYNLPAVLFDISKEKPIFIVEGEKDAECLSDFGLTATCNPNGPGNWKKEYSQYFKGASVVILPDNDTEGHKHAQSIAQSLYKDAKSIRILELPDLAKSGDVSDWIAQGNDVYLLQQLASVRPEWKPGEEDVDKSDFITHKVAKEVLSIEKKSGHLWKYVPDRRMFYFYDSKQGVWEAMPEKEYLERSIRLAMIGMNQNWCKTHHISEVMYAARDLVYDRANDQHFSNENPERLSRINLENGMLHWRSGELLPHDPGYYSTNQLPVEYDPKATCPTWKEALAQWLPEEEARWFLQEYIGYCLIPDTSLQTTVFLVGGGANGKSTFLEVVMKLYGEKNLTSIPLKRLPKRFEKRYLQDKLVNICPDINPTYMEDVGVIKTIVAGELLRGEIKSGKSFDFRPFARLIFSANTLPASIDKTEGWLRRMKIVRFPNTFRPDDEGFDPRLKQKLMQELPGILIWALTGLRRLKKNGQFTIGKSMVQEEQQYRLDNDNIAAFIDECIVEHSKMILPTAYLYRMYQQFCKESGTRAVSRKKFTTRVKDLGVEYGRKTFDVCETHGYFRCEQEPCRNLSQETMRVQKRCFFGLQYLGDQRAAVVEDSSADFR